MKIAIIIPAFNEEPRLESVLKEVKKSKYPIFVIDDGSLDHTYDIAKKYTPFVLKHRVNLGKGAALKTGCEAAFGNGFDAIIMIDADGQHSITDLPKFIKELELKNVDVIFGSRTLNFSVPLVRFIGNKIASAFVAILFKIYVSDLLCGYRALTKKAYKYIKWSSTGYGVETEMVIRTGRYKLNYCEIPVETIYHDKFKGVTIFDAVTTFFQVIIWRFS